MTNTFVFVLLVTAVQPFGTGIAVPVYDTDDNEVPEDTYINFTEEAYIEFTDCMCYGKYVECIAHFNVNEYTWNVSAIEHTGHFSGEDKQCKFYICSISSNSHSLVCHQEMQQPTACDAELECQYSKISSFCCGEFCIGTFWINSSFEIDTEQDCEYADCTSCSFSEPVVTDSTVTHAETDTTFYYETPQATTTSATTTEFSESMISINTTNKAIMFHNVNQTDTAFYISNTTNIASNKLVDYTNQTDIKVAKNLESAIENSTITLGDNVSPNGQTAAANQPPKPVTKDIDNQKTIKIVIGVIIPVLILLIVIFLLFKYRELLCQRLTRRSAESNYVDRNQEIELAESEPLNQPSGDKEASL